MANTFKLKNNAVMPSSAGTPDTLYTVPSSTTTVVIGLTLANVHTSQVTASVTVIDSSNSNETSHVIKDAPIPVGSSLEIMSGNKIILEASDIIKVDCSVADKVSATLSIMEIT
tara:strand:- start:115 stop:456 length:342 start_codon:yes stop_codon:yes gene_type:complete